MAYAKLLITNGLEVKKAPIGYSWTTFFWGGFPALFRSDWIVGILGIIANTITYGLFGVVFGFWYNKIYLKSMFNKGWWIHAHDPMTTNDSIIAYTGMLKLPEAK